MWYLDEPLTEAFTKIIGKKPDFYFFALESWRLVFVPAAHTNIATGTGRMLAWSGNKFYMMETSEMTTAKWFPDKVEIIDFKDVQSASRTRFLWIHFFNLELKDGKVLRLVANTWFYRRLHKHTEGIRLFEEKLDQKPRIE
jgi:hypothetical protein